MTSVVELEEADVDRKSLHNFLAKVVTDLKACQDNSYHHASLWKFEFSRTVLFGQEKKSNFHNFLHGDTLPFKMFGLGQKVSKFWPIPWKQVKVFWLARMGQNFDQAKRDNTFWLGPTFWRGVYE